MGGQERIVISASRRTDLVGCYPGVIVERLKKYPPPNVHSLVVWTKNPQNMIRKGELRNVLEEYRNIYVHLTVTGMGSGEFEPFIPRWREVVGMINPLLDLVGDPLRVSWRFDPILEVEGDGKAYTNFTLFPELAENIVPLGIKTCRVSWVSPYRKVVRRLAQNGWHIILKNNQERRTQADQLIHIAKGLGLDIHFCSMEGLPVSRCIDGEILSKIHPEGLVCSREKARGQRKLCGCTHSVDIGWYSLACGHGCLYCYACP